LPAQPHLRRRLNERIRLTLAADVPDRTGMSKPLIVIPARMAASRLPGKPLADIHGRPMLAWVVEAALRSGVGPVLVAAAEPAVADVARAAGARAVLTDPALPSGTDRMHAAVQALGEPYDVLVNLQGDVPTMPPYAIARAVAALTPGADIATLTSPSEDPGERDDPSIVKAIVGADGRALYFTRAPAPYGAGPVQRHLGIYVYRRAALERFVAAAPSELERRENLEQLRALELGLMIRAEAIADFPKGVDTPADLERARRELAALAAT